MINVKYNSLILFLSLFLFSCSKYNEGEVIDNFGKLVNAVMVSIENSNFKSFTDPNGNYKLDYEPGELSSSLVQKEVIKPGSLWVIKEGTNYDNHYIEYSIGAGSKYKRRRRSTRSVSGSGGGFGRKYNKRIYQGTRRLDSYNIIANFFAYDHGNQLNSYRWTLTIDCD